MAQYAKNLHGFSSVSHRDRRELLLLPAWCLMVPYKAKCTKPLQLPACGAPSLRPSLCSCPVTRCLSSQAPYCAARCGGSVHCTGALSYSPPLMGCLLPGRRQFTAFSIICCFEVKFCFFQLLSRLSPSCGSCDIFVGYYGCKWRVVTWVSTRRH